MTNQQHDIVRRIPEWGISIDLFASIHRQTWRPVERGVYWPVRDLLSQHLHGWAARRDTG